MMCNIAGYTGSRPAAPILIDMLRREQFMDGGVCTGIATIHEGKLYTAKVVGDLDVLLRTTDALNFPGTVGIAHSRPGGTLVSQAHPFLDREGKLALVLNGTLRDVDTPEFYAHSHAVMQGFLDRGFPIRSAVERSSFPPLSNGLGYHDTEPYALWIGDVVDRGNDIARDIVRGTAEAMSSMPGDIVLLSIHAMLEGTITAGRITRPMAAGLGDGGTYLATTALAFPEDAGIRNILPLPVTSVAQITPGEVRITDAKLKNVRVEEVDCGTAARMYARMEALLKGQRDDPKSLYDMPMYTDWRDIWRVPPVDCVYRKDGGLLKPYAALCYEVLWAFRQEGRLHMTLGERKGNPITKFWID